MEFGQPLITHIPIQRKKLPLEIRQATASDLERDKEAFYLMTSQWKGSKAYRLAMKTLGFKQEGVNVRININDDYDDLIRW